MVKWMVVSSGMCLQQESSNHDAGILLAAKASQKHLHSPAEFVLSHVFSPLGMLLHICILQLERELCHALD